MVKFRSNKNKAVKAAQGALSIILCATLTCGLITADIDTTALAEASAVEDSKLKIIQSAGDMSQSALSADVTPLSSDEAADKFLSADDQIWVIGTIDDQSLIKRAEMYGMTAAEYSATDEGAAYIKRLVSSQESVVRQLGNTIIDTKYNYTTVFNGVAMKIKYSDLYKLETSGKFKSVIISDSYTVPDVTENLVNVWEETGIYKSENVTDYTGQGTVIAVLDTGLDYSHSAFQTENFPTLDTDNLALTYDDITARISSLEATKLSAVQETPLTLDTDDVYISYKVPYAYDYADKDPDVFPVNDHGTHVAGIIGGNDDVITGVAINSQLAIMKVFGNEDAGAQTVDILAALSDCVLLGVDAINMSLGSSCGFSREVDDEQINIIYDSIRDAGISLVCAAGNEYSSAFNSLWGNTNLASNPDSGTVGAPASYNAAFAVASISGVKSYYLNADGELDVYFKESAKSNGDNKSFVNELLGSKSEATYEYVVIPGTGEYSNYSGIDVRGKIAVVKRGISTFEDKVIAAEEAGAIACIIYNNVSGVISMSIGRSSLPSCSVTMDIGKHFEQHGTGTLYVSKSNQAGPFMSDFSNWGVLPDLELKPDITAHGGEIYSAVRNGYDTYSGTSMACPNMAGAIILIRQHVKEQFPGLTPQEVTEMTYRLAMSTATIAYNEEGNPYSPRKQGAGLADIGKAVTTGAYLYISGQNKTKLSLGDDVKRTGVYELTFNIKNTTNKALSYKINPIVMTESLSADGITVAEKPYLFKDTKIDKSASLISGAGYTLNGDSITVAGYSDVRLTVKLSLSTAAKKYLNANFENGMYVEGFVELISEDKGGTNLNLPYLAFYGDWAAAPILDISAYDVGAEQVDSSILDEDKLQPTIYGTVPMGEFLSSTLLGDPLEAYWGMGQTGYILANGYEDVPVIEDKASLTQDINGLYSFRGVSAGLLRGAKTINMTIKNAYTGEVVFTRTSYNARKAYGSGGSGGFVEVGFNVNKLKLPNNAKYVFEMECFLEGEYGLRQNNNNKFSFSFYIDNESPSMVDAETTIKYDTDSSGNITRRYLELAFYDNHYIQGFFLQTFAGMDGEGKLIDSEALISGMIPTPDFARGTVNKFKLDITAYWNKIMENGGNLYVRALDYARNSVDCYIDLSDYISDITGISFRNDRTQTININGQVDLRSEVVIEPRGTLTDDISWKSSNDSIAIVHDGVVTGISEGTVTITAYGGMNPETGKPYEATKTVTVRSTASGSGIVITGIKLSDTVLQLVVGETYEISATVEPYNTTVTDYELVWSTTNSARVKVEVNPDDQTKALITVLEYADSTVYVSVSVRGSLINSRCAVRVKEEFVVESRYLRQYNGRGDENGVVEIPDDLGILYIYQGAFLNNDYIKKVIIPEGVEQIMDIAFYGCDSLEEIVLPESCKKIGLFSIGWNPLLTKINLENLVTIGELAFYNCPKLDNINLSNVAFLGDRAFAFCTGLTSIDLSNVKYMGQMAFVQCTALREIITSKFTQIGYMAFALCTALTELEFYGNALDAYAFYGCTALRSVKLNSDLNAIGAYAFYSCTALRTLEFNASVGRIDTAAFASCSALTEVKLPNGLTSLGALAFYYCSSLTSVTASVYTQLTSIGQGAFVNCTQLKAFDVEEGARYLEVREGILYDKGMKTLILVPFVSTAASRGFTVPSSVTKIGNYAFSYVQSMTYVDFANVTTIGDGAFFESGIQEIRNAAKVKYIGEGAFYETALRKIIIPENVEYIGRAAFAYIDDGSESYELIIPTSVTYLGDNVFMYSTGFVSFKNLSQLTELPYGTFAYCTDLSTVNSASLGNFIKLGDYSFVGCSSLTEVDFTGSKVEALGESTFASCSALNKVTLTENFTEIAPYAFALSGLTEIILPDSVTSIGEYAFAASKLEHVYYSDGSYVSEGFNNVKVINEGAFMDAPIAAVYAPNVEYVAYAAFATESGFTSRLVSVNMPNATYIDSHAFYGAIVLTEVNLPKAEYIGDRAFYNARKLTEITLPEVRKIGEYAFYSATVLASVSMPKVESIGVYAFSGSVLTEVTLSAQTSYIAPLAFYSIRTLAAVNVPQNNPYYFTAADGAIYRNLPNGKYELLYFPQASSATEVTILGNTVRIADYAFANNSVLTKVIIPDTLRSIGSGAFYKDSNLSEIVMNCVVAPVLESEYASGFDYTYTNFKEMFGSNVNLVITVPTNAQGYNSWTWIHYVGDVTIRENDIQRHENTIDLIERLTALSVEKLTAADYNDIMYLNRLYSLMEESQKSFISSENVAKLNAAVARVTQLHNENSGNNDNNHDSSGEEEGKNPGNLPATNTGCGFIVGGVVGGIILLLGGIFVGILLFNRRRAARRDK